MAPLYAALVDAGVRPFGVYALNAMRMEKGYGGWGGDLTTERTPLEAGLDHLVKAEGRDFIGRDAMMARATSGEAWHMVLLELDGAATAYPFSVHSVLRGDRAVGMVTTAAYGHRIGRSLALAYLTPEAGTNPNGLSVLVLGQAIAATVLDAAPYDPDNRLPRDG
jgi:dimethylglycine dehydrogenase